MSTEVRKGVVRRFNAEVIGDRSRNALDALMDPGFVNPSALIGTPNGPESMWTPSGVCAAVSDNA